MGNRNLSLALDSGACANVISYTSLINLQNKLNRKWEIKPVDQRLSSVTGHDLNLLGMTQIPYVLPGTRTRLETTFYVVEKLPLPADGLLGLEALSAGQFVIDPGHRRVFQGKRTFSAMVNPRPLHGSISAIPTIPTPSPAPIASSSRVVNAKSDGPKCHVRPLVVPAKQRIRAREWVKLTVQLPIEDKNLDIACLSDSACVKGVLLESTLVTAAPNATVEILLFNKGNHPIRLKKGCVLGQALVYDNPIDPEAPEWPMDNKFISAISKTSLNGNDPASTREENHVHEGHDQLKGSLGNLDYPNAKDSLLQLLESYRDVIALPGEHLGKTDLAKHYIPLKPDTNPVYTPAYRLPHYQREVVKEIIDDLLAQNVIRQSSSAWNAPLFLVPKKDGGWRPVIDYRKVNQVTIPDRFPMPVLSELLQGIGEGNSIFTTLDLLSGYWQVCMDERSTEVTAFSTPMGHYEWLRMPFGLRNAPLTFQRLVNNLFAGLLGDSVFAYLDDIIVCSKDIPTHLQKLQQVFERLQEAGLRVKLSKCDFLRSKIKFLGHEVDAEGIHTQNDKVKAVQNFPTPVSTENVQSFLGLSGYYRSFVKNFASIARPLTRLLRKGAPFTWGPDQEASFQHLKTALTTAPILVFPDYQRKFTIYTDASIKGVGAVLAQPDKRGKMQTIGYASRVLNDRETRYHATEWEALAVAWGLKHFRDIILGYQIDLFTDNEAVKKVFKGGKNLTGRLARWYETVLQFDPVIHHIKGKANVVADALSRNFPVAPICSVPVLTKEQLAEEQRKDPIWGKVVFYLESGDDSALPHLKIPLDQFQLQDDLLVRVLPHTSDDKVKVIVPDTLKEIILSQLHDAPQAAHPGKQRMLHVARQKYFWNTMRRDIEAHIAKCHSCAEHKGTTGGAAPILEYPTPSLPFDTVSVDLLKLPKSHQGSQFLLVCVDFLTRFVILTPLKTKTAEEVGHALLSHLILPFTTPKTLLSDNGLEFRNGIVKSICNMYNIQQTFITAYHPASNGLVERMNRSVLNVLRHVTKTLDNAWEDWLPQVAATINGSVNASTGKSPHYILYGDDKSLPYELLVQKMEPVYNLEDYSKRHIQVLKKIHQEVRTHLSASRAEMIRIQHRNATEVNIEVGDCVMLLDPTRNSKLAPKFKGPYIISGMAGGNKFQIEDPSSHETEVVHVDRLKKVSKTLLTEEGSQVQRDNEPQDQNSASLPQVHQAVQPAQPFQQGVNNEANAYRLKLRSASRV